MNATWVLLPLLVCQVDAPITVRETDAYVEIETDALQARINKKGYVSGIAAGSLIDKKTGAKDLGFGLHIMDFLLAPGWRDDEYLRNKALHGDLPKHYVEGPQICTQAKKLNPRVIRGKDFVAVVLQHRFTEARQDLKAGSLWQQIMVFQPGKRYILSAEKITSANTLDNIFYRIDMPGHIRHQKGDTFSKIYLSYFGEITAEKFLENFAPDDRYLYQRSDQKMPQRMIRAYKIRQKSGSGPWLAGMTLDPTQVSEAWCHQRGYVCFIQELHGKAIRVGESFGAAYVVGFFDSIKEMQNTYDQYRGATGIALSNDSFRFTHAKDGNGE